MPLVLCSLGPLPLSFFTKAVNTQFPTFPGYTHIYTRIHTQSQRHAVTHTHTLISPHVQDVHTHVHARTHTVSKARRSTHTLNSPHVQDTLIHTHARTNTNTPLTALSGPGLRCHVPNSSEPH